MTAGADRRGGRATRHDGWTPERIRTFLVTLADCGCVTDAAEAAKISLRSAYNLRNRAEGRAFHYAWEAALRIARHRLADVLMSRAMHGCVDQVRRNGEVVAERVRFDNRLAMAMLTRLDQHVAANEAEDEAVEMVVEEFDQFVGIVSAGGAGASDFIAARRTSARDRAKGGVEVVLDRLDNFARYGVGHPSEIDVADLDLAAMEEWTAEQRERARRAGLERRTDKTGEEVIDTTGVEWRKGPPIIGFEHAEFAPGLMRLRTKDGNWRVSRREPGWPFGVDGNVEL